MNFKDCILKELVKISKFSTIIINSELMTADKFLTDSERLLKLKESNASGIFSYLSMFHYSRAYLYTKGYKEKSHFCVFQYLAEDENKILTQLGEKGQHYRYLRELIQYEGSEITASVAKNMLKDAKSFKQEISKLCK